MLHLNLRGQLILAGTALLSLSISCSSPPGEQPSPSLTAPITNYDGTLRPSSPTPSTSPALPTTPPVASPGTPTALSPSASQGESTASPSVETETPESTPGVSSPTAQSTTPAPTTPTVDGASTTNSITNSVTPTSTSALTPTSTAAVTPTALELTASNSNDTAAPTATSLPTGTAPSPTPVAETHSPAPTQTGTPTIIDDDSDGFASDEDCDDNNPGINPDATERCDGLDQDCDEQVDEGVLNSYYVDLDGDGFGDPEAPAAACEPSGNLVVTAGDCDDSNDDIYPGGTELCGGLDEDCDGSVDESGADDVNTWYLDRDEDGYGDEAVSTQTCDQPIGYVTSADDCDDLRPGANPDATEICNSKDEDCDSEVDEAPANGAPIWYLDNDGDGFGDSNQPLASCTEPEGRSGIPGDCDDTNADIRPGGLEVCDAQGLDEDCDGLVNDDDGSTDPLTMTTWFDDYDEDGYGDDNISELSCDAPAGYVSTGGDCDDGSADYNPGATESCETNEDLNCDGSVGFLDGDEDGFAACVDCNDADAAVNPDAVEICDDGNVDEDCSGASDDDDPGVLASSQSTYYHDVDTDGFGDSSSSVQACDDPTTSADWWSLKGTDCNDRDPDIKPGAVESCDGVDSDCDDLIDEDAIDSDAFYVDADSDGFGTADTSLLACELPEGYSASDEDCDDEDSEVSPQAAETCDGIDNNCDQLIDDASSEDADVYYPDDDSDGWGKGSQAQSACSPPDETWVTQAGDCNDGSSTIHPLADELCNDRDDDCDDVSDEDSIDMSTFYLDGDSDGYGDIEDSLQSCDRPSGYVAVAGDCNDSDSAYNPGAQEACGVLEDLNCDGSVNDVDQDSDGFVACEDCNDGDSDIYPGATESCDTLDQDCDGLVDEGPPGDATSWWPDTDGDTYGDAGEDSVLACNKPSAHVSNNGDCDDNSIQTNPGSAETCNGSDDDCDNSIDEESNDAVALHADSDGDGYGAAGDAATLLCPGTEGYVNNSFDCDDDASTINPDAAELCSDGMDNNCDGDSDCTDESCLGSNACLGAELCDNQSDDNGDYLVDCADPYCADSEHCSEGLECFDVDIGGFVGTRTDTFFEQGDRYTSDCMEAQASPDFAYQWTVPEAGDYTLTQVGEMTSSISIWSGCQGTYIGCTAGYDGGSNAVLTDLSKDQTIIIVVDKVAGDGDDFDFTINATEAFKCDDGNDNDGDGLTDCDDPECSSQPSCNSSTPTPEPTATPIMGWPDDDAPALSIGFYISEYVEGSSYNKALELYNGTGEDIDLGRVSVQLANGTNPNFYSHELTGILAAGEVFLIANPDAASSITDLADELVSQATWNGNDPIGLAFDGIVVDVIGSLGEGYLSGWDVAGVPYATANHTLVRKPEISSGITDWDLSAGSDDINSQWLVYDADTVDDLGSHTTTGDLFISEYIEGIGENKAIEIYNPSDVSMELSTLSLVRATNGTSWENAIAIPLSGVIGPQETYVCVFENASAGLLAVADMTSSDLNFNGDDAIALARNGVLVDVIGLGGEDPGLAWPVAGVDDGTRNHTLVRKASISEGNLNWSLSSGTDTDDSEWVVYPQDTYSYLGAHPGEATAP